MHGREGASVGGREGGEGGRVGRAGREGAQEEYKTWKERKGGREMEYLRAGGTEEERHI